MQLDLPGILEQAREIPSVFLTVLPFGGTQRMFLKKHWDARLRPWVLA